MGCSRFWERVLVHGASRKAHGELACDGAIPDPGRHRRWRRHQSWGLVRLATPSLSPLRQRDRSRAGGVLKWGHEYVDKGLLYYEERHRQQQVQFLKKRAASSVCK